MEDEVLLLPASAAAGETVSPWIAQLAHSPPRRRRRKQVGERERDRREEGGGEQRGSQSEGRGNPLNVCWGEICRVCSKIKFDSFSVPKNYI